MSILNRIFGREHDVEEAEPPEELKELYGPESAPPTAAEETPANAVISQDDQDHARQVMEDELRAQREALAADRREEALRR